jgi:tRNA A37 threonylcarbamoyladenosine synthetase subunit TsaC/SUA5/YrdC
MPTHRTVAEIFAQFGEKRDLIYQVTNCPSELPLSEPSTVVDARGNIPVVIREGAIPTVAIMQVVV